jgi:hypothetical protein
MNKKWPELRSKSGSIMLIVLVFAVLLCAGLVCFFNVQISCLANDKATATANSMALRLAILLNGEDHVGRMNNLVAQSRDLVYYSRQQYDETLGNQYSNLQPLAHRLLDDARWGAVIAESGRQELLIQTMDQLRTEALNDKSPESCGMKLQELEVGRFDQSTCNVTNHADEPLQTEDERMRLCDSKSKLFAPNINAKLENRDSDLSFKLSALPPPRLNFARPAALIHGAQLLHDGTLVQDGEPYLDGDPAYMPCAVKVKLIPSERAPSSVRPTVPVYAAACTSGAQPMP